MTRTYAGGARTVRRADPKEEGNGTDEALLFPPKPLAAASTIGAGVVPPARRETYASLRLLWGIDAEETLDAGEEQDSQDRGARVVGAGVLRKQGQGKRWMDELGWMCDGLRAGAGTGTGTGTGTGGSESGDRGAARACAVELVEKALERDWLRRLKSSGQGETVYLALRLASRDKDGFSSAASSFDNSISSPDRVLDVATATTLALFVRDQRLVEPLFRLSPRDVRAARASHASKGRAGPLGRSDPSAQEADDDNEEGDRSDLLDLLKGLLVRQNAGDVIGGGEDEGGTAAGRKSKAVKAERRHVSWRCRISRRTRRLTIRRYCVRRIRTAPHAPRPRRQVRPLCRRRCPPHHPPQPGSLHDPVDRVLLAAPDLSAAVPPLHCRRARTGRTGLFARVCGAAAAHPQVRGGLGACRFDCSTRTAR